MSHTLNIHQRGIFVLGAYFFELHELRTCPIKNVCVRFLGGGGTEELALYRVSGHLYTVSFDSNLGDVEVRNVSMCYTAAETC